MELHRTDHASARHQARATLPLFESLVLDYGTRCRAHGADVVFIDGAARKRIRAAVGGRRGMRAFERYANQYLIVGDDGQIITTGYRTHRVRRP